jgi:AcrR family transcriptional regulator
MSRSPRKLNLKARAERQMGTRRRITEAAVALHEAVGPANASISAVARKAGVQRLTVYRHFPDQASLFQACSAHYMGAHPPPDPTPWLAEPDPVARLERSLQGLYGYYRSTAAMNSMIMRDVELVPGLKTMLEGYEGFIAMLTDMLAGGWDTRRSERVLRAALRHALEFKTWQALTGELSLSDQEAVALMTGMVAAA